MYKGAIKDKMESMRKFNEVNKNKDTINKMKIAVTVPKDPVEPVPKDPAVPAPKDPDEKVLVTKKARK